MDQFKFSLDHSSMIVKAIVDGYREYIDHRKDRNENMIISSAFAWTKGNFIESQIAKTCKTYGFSFKRSKAGPTWDYLQFVNDELKKLFLIKNARYFNETSFSNANLPIPGKQEGKQRTYLHELSKINSSVKFPSKSEQFEENPIQFEQLSFLTVPQETAAKLREQLELLKTEYSTFHILTYRLDSAQQIAEIKHYLPNPHNNIAYPVEDLSEYISGAELTDEERSIIAPEREDIVTPEEFDIGILEEELENE